ncbi:MAG: type I pullulanase [Chitinophagaceae bacterium]|nr:type I pullulanase [Chitinophagaceae bacterium]
MKNYFLLLLFSVVIQKATAQFFGKGYSPYTGKDLGLTYSATSSTFKIWSPTAVAAQLLLYKEGLGGTPFKTVALAESINGTWEVKLDGEWKGNFYTFRVKIKDTWSNEVPDPYAKAVGINGKRAMVIDLYETNPPGWEKDKSPAFSKKNLATDAVIYELHIRDASIGENSCIKHKGKYLGLAEENTKNKEGLSTGLLHIKELGVTHVHLLPFFDYNSVDESLPGKVQYNWGYDPLNYNVPEGSYSTNPYDGTTRINELKTMVAAFHKHGLSVVMDVVYNHVANAASSNFEQLVPGYYFRHKKEGSFSDATACGNETASEMPMMRKFILESVLYWATEYHIDGFRFDLMGVHDIETMNLVSTELRKIKPDILLYGEGWTAGASPLPDSLRALKKNAHELKHIAVFSDDVRDGIKGSVFDIKDKGFVSGKPGMEESIKFGIVAACEHPQVDLNKVNYSKMAYAAAPWNVITYCECHDNNTLWDKLAMSCPDASKDELLKMHQLALTIVLTSQGIPFLHAGTEFLRNKNSVENSYNAGDSINAVDWHMKQKNYNVYKYVAALIKIRKEHPAFRLVNAAQIKGCIRFDEKAPAGTIVYTIDGAAVKDKWKKIFIAFNANKDFKTISLPPGRWQTAPGAGSPNKSKPGKRNLPGLGSMILYQE